MKKLKLKIEALRVEQFLVVPEGVSSDGTVLGQEGSFMTCQSCPCASPPCNNGGDTQGCGTIGATDPCLYCLPQPIE